MDKFGIFNLLSSLLDKNLHTDNTEQTLNSDTEEKIQNPKPVPNLPLQSNMINTMNSHDLFVKRVKEKNKKI